MESIGFITGCIGIGLFVGILMIGIACSFVLIDHLKEYLENWNKNRK